MRYSQMRFYHGKKEMLYVNRCSAPRCSALCFLTSFLPFNFLQSLLFGRQNGLIVSEKPLPGSQHKNHTIFMFGALVARCMGLRLRGCQSASLPLLRPKVRIPLRTCSWPWQFDHVGRVCQLSAGSRGYSPGSPVSSHKES